MLLTLILNLGMAAGVTATPPPVTPGGAGIKARRPNKGHTFSPPVKNYDKQKKDDKDLIDFLDALIN